MKLFSLKNLRYVCYILFGFKNKEIILAMNNINKLMYLYNHISRINVNWKLCIFFGLIKNILWANYLNMKLLFVTGNIFSLNVKQDISLIPKYHALYVLFWFYAFRNKSDFIIRILWHIFAVLYILYFGLYSFKFYFAWSEYIYD